MEHLSHSEQETEQLGEQVARKLPRGTVIAYTGELGMGKTAFTRGLARGLGCRGRVTSPTFTIVNEYEGDIPLFHFDLYRPIVRRLRLVGLARDALEQCVNFVLGEEIGRHGLVYWMMKEVKSTSLTAPSPSLLLEPSTVFI